jgi:hypothetical protein
MRTTVYLDDALYGRLRQYVPGRGLNRFINEAVAEKIEALEKQRLMREMREGYLATRDDRAELNQDWDAVDTEGWPE